MDKEFGNLSEEELALCLAMFQEIESTFFEGDSILPFKDGVPSWGRLYELPFEQVISLAIAGLRIGDEFLDASKSENPQGAILELAREDDDTAESAYDLEPWALPTLIATIFNLRCIAKFQIPMSELVSLAEGGDTDSMLRAIRLDPMSLHSEPIARIHSSAIAQRDSDLLELIHKAQAGKSPRLPGSQLSNVRLAAQLLQQSGAMQSLTVEQLRELVVDRLDLYPSDGDSHSAVRSVWRENKKLRGD
jgi:hypothetical protein